MGYAGLMCRNRKLSADLLQAAESLRRTALGTAPVQRIPQEHHLQGRRPEKRQLPRRFLDQGRPVPERIHRQHPLRPPRYRRHRFPEQTRFLSGRRRRHRLRRAPAGRIPEGPGRVRQRLTLRPTGPQGGTCSPSILTGKNALVTGASQGIGQAIAMQAGPGRRQGGGPLFHPRDRHPAISPARCSPSRPTWPRRRRRGNCSVPSWNPSASLDILVNNAGLAIDSPLDLDDERWLADWQYIMDVNLTACGILCREAVRHFKDRGGGRIINIASRAAFRGDIAAYLAYASSKGGMVALTRSLARAFGKDNIQAFVIAPGFTRTKMAQQFIDIHGEELVLKDIALNRLTEPEDIAPTVAFLASGLADHATGCTIDINAASYVH